MRMVPLFYMNKNIFFQTSSRKSPDYLAVLVFCRILAEILKGIEL